MKPPGLATADSPVVCPGAYTVQGVTIHNDDGMSEPAITPLWYDFAVSCNDAFTQWWQKLSAPSGAGSNLLAATAKRYYGLDEPWDIGIAGQSAQYFTAPPSASGSELTEEDFGEGELETCPLAMASNCRDGGERDVQAASPGARHQADPRHAHTVVGRLPVVHGDAGGSHPRHRRG